MSEKLRAIITAGPNREWLDKVRFQSNLSKGGFGAALAHALNRSGVEVTLLAGNILADRLRPYKLPFEVVEFDTFSDLQSSIIETVDRIQPDLFFMAAAVADFSPEQAAGKISSDKEKLLVEYHRNPKILPTLRELCGRETFIVGFKLEVDLPTSELMDIAKGQVVSSRLNLTVANDTSNIDFKKGYHPIVMVTPEGGTIPVSGMRDVVAQRLADFVLKRNDVNWFSTNFEYNESLESPGPLSGIAKLDSFARSTKLLQSKSGNVSALIDPKADRKVPEFYVSPRQVDKSKMLLPDYVKVSVDTEERLISCSGTRKSSIDTGVQALLYKAFPNVEGFLHFHPHPECGHALVLPDFVTEFPYPCGTQEEAEEVVEHLGKAFLNGKSPDESFIAELRDHGYLLAIANGGINRLEQTWQRYCFLYGEHLDEIGEPSVIRELDLYPVLALGRVCGVLAHHKDGWSSLYIPEENRGLHLGEQLIDQLRERGDLISAHDRCEVVDYYRVRGYEVIERNGKQAILRPPTQREDLLDAASICLVNPHKQTVLLGERLVEPWKGYFSFPGGGVDEGETSYEAARRELTEETRIVLGTHRYQRSDTYYVGNTLDYRVAKVENFVQLVFEELKPEDTDELKATWYPISEAMKLKMGPGTKRRVRWLAEAFEKNRF